MVISHNLLAMNAQRQFNIVGNKRKKSTEKMSSGFKINRAADDAAGLTISEKMRSQIRGLTQGVENTQDGISLLQVADGALAEVHDMLHKVTELSVKSANGTNTTEDREVIQAEITEILSEIDRISDYTEFNTRKLFRGQKKAPISSGEDPSVPVEDPHETLINNSNSARSSIRSTITASTTLTNNFNIDFTFTADKDPRSLKVNGTTVDLSSISGNGCNFSADTIKAGTYSLQSSGVNFSFSLDKDYSQEEVLRAINGLKMNVKGVTENIVPVKTSISPNDGQNAPNSFFGASGVRKHTLTVSETGVGLDGGTTVSWSDLGVDLNDSSTYAGKQIIVTDPDTGVKFRINTHSSVNNKNSFLDYLRLTSVTSNTNLPHTTTYSRADENSGTLDRDGTYFIKYTKALYDKMGITYGAPLSNTLRFEGDSTDNFKVILRASQTGLEQSFNIRASDVADVLYPGGSGWVHFDDDTGSSLQMYIKNKSVQADNFYTVLKSRSPVPEGAGIWYTTYTSDYSTFKKMNLSQSNASFVYQTDAWDQENPDPIDPEEPEPYDIYKEYDDLSLWIQSGAHEGDGMYIKIGIMDTNTIGISGVNVSTLDGARKAIESVKGALSKVSEIRSSIGAQQNRLEHTIDNENNIVENTTAAESRIRDTDMAKESANLAVQNILTQAGVAMMAQANQSAQGVMRLLQ